MTKLWDIIAPLQAHAITLASLKQMEQEDGFVYLDRETRENLREYGDEAFRALIAFFEERGFSFPAPPPEPPVEPDEPEPEPDEPEPPIVVEPAPIPVPQGGSVPTVMRTTPLRNDGKPVVFELQGRVPAFSVPKTHHTASANSPGAILRGGTIARHSSSGSDTVFIPEGVHRLAFEEMDVERSHRAMFMTAVRKGDAAPNVGLTFRRVYSAGPTYDHATGKGPMSKWGLLGHHLAELTIEECVWHGFALEHAVYLHNTRGNVAIRDSQFYRCGRTAIQMVNRLFEDGKVGQPEGTGAVSITDCLIADCGISRSDAYHGGSAITFAGRHRGPIQLEGVAVSMGYDALLDVAGTAQQGWPGLYAALGSAGVGKPLHAGLMNACLMAWTESSFGPQRMTDPEFWNDIIDIGNCAFRQNRNAQAGSGPYPKGAGADAAVVIDGTSEAVIEDTIIEAGGTGQALKTRRHGHPPLGTLHFEGLDNVVDGKVIT